MHTVAELLSLVAKALPPNEPILTVTRETVAPSLPTPVQESLAPLWKELNQLVPSGIDYALTLSANEAVLYLASPVTTQSFPLRKDASLPEQLHAIEWDKLRTAPPPAELFFSASFSTKTLQRLFREDVRQWIREVRKDANRIHILYYDEAPEFDEELDDEEDDGPRLDTLSFPNMTVFLEELESLMRNARCLVSVVSEGKPWSVERIDRLKREIANRLQGGQGFHPAPAHTRETIPVPWDQSSPRFPTEAERAGETDGTERRGQTYPEFAGKTRPGES